MTYRTLTDPLITQYLRSGVREPHELLSNIRRDAERTDSEVIHISPEQGAFLALLVQLRQARRIVEVGTHWGYSTLWLASAATSGAFLDTIEVDIIKSQRAEEVLQNNPFPTAIRVHHGPANVILPSLPSRSYDFAFIDGEKNEYLQYLEMCSDLLNKGGVIVADNTLHKGRVADPSLYKSSTAIIVEFNRRLLESNNWTTSIVPIGDGMTVAIRNS